MLTIDHLRPKLIENFDGKIDYIAVFDRKGMVDSVSSDEDFNGTFETDTYYVYDNASFQESDTTGDGFKDYRIKFKDGRYQTVTFYDAVSKKPIKIQTYGMFGPVSAELDSDGDGQMDTFYQYDAIEELISTSHTTK